MALLKALRFLLLGVHTALAQIYANGPFQLHISSLSDASINGHAYPCQDTLGLCYSAGDVSPQAADGGFIFTSRGRADYTTGYLSWRSNNKNSSSSSSSSKNGNKQTAGTVTAYGPIGLIYDPGTNVAVPVFNQSGAPGTLGFDTGTGVLVMNGIDDTAMSGGGNGSTTTTTTTTTSNSIGNTRGGRVSSDTGETHDRNYNNWYLCLVQLETNQQAQMLVSWVLGANLGWLPTNPTCQRINITMEAGARGYGGSLRNSVIT